MAMPCLRQSETSFMHIWSEAVGVDSQNVSIILPPPLEMVELSLAIATTKMLNASFGACESGLLDWPHRKKFARQS